MWYPGFGILEKSKQKLSLGKNEIKTFKNRKSEPKVARAIQKVGGKLRREESSPV